MSAGDSVFEDAAAHWRVEDPWCRQTVAPNTINEGLGFPMAERSIGDETAILSGPSGAFYQARVRENFTDIDETRQ